MRAVSSALADRTLPTMVLVDRDDTLVVHELLSAELSGTEDKRPAKAKAIIAHLSRVTLKKPPPREHGEVCFASRVITRGAMRESSGRIRGGRLTKHAPRDAVFSLYLASGR